MFKLWFCLFLFLFFAASGSFGVGGPFWVPVHHTTRSGCPFYASLYNFAPLVCILEQLIVFIVLPVLKLHLMLLYGTYLSVFYVPYDVWALSLLTHSASLAGGLRSQCPPWTLPSLFPLPNHGLGPRLLNSLHPRAQSLFLRPEQSFP